MTKFKPLLAAPLMPSDLPHSDDNILAAMKQLRYPVWGSLKLDGIRGVRCGDLFSRTLKLIPNIQVRFKSMKLPTGFDCELYNPELAYDEIESIVMSEIHPDYQKIQFHVLDWYDNGTAGYLQRCIDIQRNLSPQWADVHFGFPVLCKDADELMQFFLRAEQDEGEGICFRLANGLYVQKSGIENRSTLREQLLVKLARFVRTEVTVLRIIEASENTNREKRNALGKMDRSHTIEGRVGKGMLGAFWVRNAEGLEFKVGAGVMKHRDRITTWQEQDKWVGQTITIKSKAHGVKVKPRSPTYCGLRKDGQ
jgi:hypothetical protein